MLTVSSTTTLALAPPTRLGKLGIVLVTSPTRSHPDTSLVWGALGSTALVRGCEAAPIQIVCDGYRTPADLQPEHATRTRSKLERQPSRLSKRGIVTEEIAEGYEAYKRRLCDEVAARGLSDRITIDECESHHGFALCVRRGLEDARSRGLRYALVMQHDRAFIRRFDDLRTVLRRFDEDPSMRYVGFATSTSKLLATRLQPKYKLGTLLEARSHTLRRGLLLRPTTFWFDSNHVVEIARAQQALFEPYTAAPPWLREAAAAPLGGMGAFTLRRADFIEDRYGVSQRALLSSLRARPAELLRAFDWFGSYILEETVAEGDEEGGADEQDDGPSTVCELVDARGRVSHVAHMDGRSSAPRAWLHMLPAFSSRCARA